jgi:hypothetical protein
MNAADVASAALRKNITQEGLRANQYGASVRTVIGDHWVVVRSYALHHCDAKQLTKPFFSQRTRERRSCAARLVYARLL